MSANFLRPKVLITLALTILSCRPALAAGEGWILHQKSDYLGQQVLYLSPYGMKINSKAMNTIVLAASRKVILYNDKTKSFYESSYADWIKKYVTPASGPGRTIQKGKTGEVAGVKAVQYFFKNIIGKKVRITEEYWVGQDPCLPAQVIDAVDRISNLPAGLGIPLKIFKINDAGKSVTALDTVRCQRKPVPNSTFTFPPGYKRVKDAMTMVLGSDPNLDSELDNAMK